MNEAIPYHELDEQLPLLPPLEATTIAAQAALDAGLFVLVNSDLLKTRHEINNARLGAAIQRLQIDLRRLEDYTNGVWEQLSSANSRPVSYSGIVASSACEWVSGFGSMLLTKVYIYVPSTQPAGEALLPRDSGDDWERLVASLPPADEWFETTGCVSVLIEKEYLNAKDRSQDQDRVTNSRTAAEEDDESEMARALAVMPDDHLRILAIAKDSTKSVDDRLRAMTELDATYYSKDSMELAPVLGCSASAIRQTRWWKLDRPNYLHRRDD